MKAEEKYINTSGEVRRKKLFPEVTDEQWNDWHWQVSHRISDVDTLKKYLPLTPEEEQGKEGSRNLPDGNHSLLPVPDQS